jgi:exosome complex exonuclease DIS3/RRP44
LYYSATYVEKLPSESPNDRNDRAIRVAAKWYQEHLKDTGAEIVLLTNDRDNKKKAIEMGINAQQGTLLSFIHT